MKIMMSIDRRGFRSLPALLFLLLCLALPAVSAASTRLEGVSQGGVRALLEFEADPLVSMTPVPFRLRIEDASGKPISGAGISCDLTMPAMAMPENRPQVRESGGDYVGEAIFTMAGAWRATFDLALPGGGDERVVFDMERVLMK